MDKISPEHIQKFLASKGLDAKVVQLKDTLGNQQLFRVELKGVKSLKDQESAKQLVSSEFHTKVTDVRFINENMHYDYNGSHMLIYDIELKYDNVYSAKMQMQIDDNTYGYDVLFDDMKGIIEWNEDWKDINQLHIDDGTSRDFKGLIDMFNIDLQNHVNIAKHVKNGTEKKKKKKQKDTEILINYDQAHGLVSFIVIKGHNLSSTSFNKMIQELSSQALYVTYKKRENELEIPDEILIGKSGTYMNDNDMTNITKIFSKFGIDTSNYQYVTIRDLSVLPASALIRTAIQDDQKRDL